MYLICGPRQLFFQCGPETPKGWTPLARDSCLLEHSLVGGFKLLENKGHKSWKQGKNHSSEYNKSAEKYIFLNWTGYQRVSWFSVDKVLPGPGSHSSFQGWPSRHLLIHPSVVAQCCPPLSRGFRFSSDPWGWKSLFSLIPSYPPLALNWMHYSDKVHCAPFLGFPTVHSPALPSALSH